MWTTSLFSDDKAQLRVYQQAIRDKLHEHRVRLNERKSRVSGCRTELKMSLAHEPPVGSRIKTRQPLWSGQKRQRRPVQNGHEGCDELGVRFKRAPVPPTILRSSLLRRSSYGWALPLRSTRPFRPQGVGGQAIFQVNIAQQKRELYISS
jgi:hypothetical protein